MNVLASRKLDHPSKVINVDLRYNIVVDTDLIMSQYVQVDFHAMKLKKEDFLIFYDGWNSQAPVIGIFDDDKTPAPLISSQSNLFAIFDVKLDSSGAEGFYVKYCADKGRYCIRSIIVMNCRLWKKNQLTEPHLIDRD